VSVIRRLGIVCFVQAWAMGAAAQGAAELAAPIPPPPEPPPDSAYALATPSMPDVIGEEPQTLAVELGLRVGHGVAMEWDRVFGGQLATWLGGTLAFGGERFSGTIAYDAAIGTAAHDAWAHAIAARVGYDLDAGPGRTRITLSVGPYFRFGRVGTTECLTACTEEAIEARDAADGILPFAAGATLVLDALQPIGPWLLGVSVEARGTAPIEDQAVGGLELLMSFRVARDLAQL
jgi:hypothetical protein